MKKFLLILVSSVSLNVLAIDQNAIAVKLLDATGASIKAAVYSIYNLNKVVAAQHISAAKIVNPFTGKSTTVATSKELVEMSVAVAWEIKKGLESQNGITGKKLIQAAGTSFATEKVLALLSYAAASLGIASNNLVKNKRGDRLNKEKWAMLTCLAGEELARQNIREIMNAKIEGRNIEWTFFSIDLEI